MHAWEAIQTTLEFIENHYAESLDIEELAGAAALSPFYFQRLFSRLVKKPVREYIKLRRLAHASQLLEDSNQRILDIALETGFSSHETLTRAFKEAYGITPEAFRKKPVYLNHFDKPDLMLNYTMVSEGVPLISDGIVLEYNHRTIEEPLHFMGVTGMIPIADQMPLGEVTGIDLPGEVWERFHCEKTQIPRIANSREVGVAYLGDVPEGYFTYFAGAEVAKDAENEKFVKWTLPPRDYIVCGFEAENFEELVTVAINKVVKYTELWMQEHHYTQELYSPEIYYDSSPEASYMEFWIPYIELDKK